MENEKWETENEKRPSGNAGFSDSPFSPFSRNQCAACGASAERETAKFCRVCGKLLTEDYEPLDRLRASYLLQTKTFTTENARAEEINSLFEINKNSASESAKALVVYSLVPYLGILFCPFALLWGGIGVLVARRQPHLGGGRASVYSIAAAVIIFFVQVFLWWLFYVVPELGKSI